MNAAEPTNRPQAPDANVSKTIAKGVVLTVVVATGFLAYRNFGSMLTLSNLATQETALRAFQDQHPVLIYGLALLVYMAVTGLSLPGAAALTLLYGWYFGVARGVIVVSFGSTAGATLAFLLSRYLIGETIQRRFGDRLASFNESLQKEGAFYLFTLRLIPAVPFFVINAVMGLTKLRTSTFWWVSQLGMLPGTAVYVYAGASVPDLKTLADHGIQAVFTPSQLAQIISAFVLLGVFPIVVKKLIERFRRPGKPTEQALSH